MTTTIRFNTGRKYTSDGQLIVATLHDDRTVTFMDHSRGISGQFELGLPADLSESIVMDHYDNLHYQNGARSWNDGMSRGGCNSR
jgi:hypothetical protein